MAMDMTIFEGAKANLPAYLTDLFGGEDEGNLAPKETIPSLSYGGKIWTISANGEKTRLMKVDADGDEQPVTTMQVIVLDFAKSRGRAFYPGAFDPDKPGAPECWSDDGKTPDASVAAPQHGTCEGCPMAAKGSKVSENGKAVTACSQHRMLAVVPAAKPDFTPLRLKLAITSDWDKESTDLIAQNWFAFQQYQDFLRARGVPHTAAIVTKMKFDPNTNYPKVIFSPFRPLTQAEANLIAPIAKSDAVKDLLGRKWTPAGADGVATGAAPAAEQVTHDPAVAAAARVAADTKARAEAKAKAAEAAAEAAAKAALAAKKKAETEAAKAPAKEKFIVDDDGDGDIILPGAKSPAAAAAKPVVAAKADAKPAKAPVEATPAAVPDDVASLLAEWGED